MIKIVSPEQEDKEPLFDSVRTILGMLEVTTEFACNITFNRAKIERALPAGHLDATTLADYLVKKVNRILLCFFTLTRRSHLSFSKSS